MEIQGEVGTFEGASVNASLSRHLLGWRAHYQWLAVALFVAGAFLAVRFSNLLLQGAGLILIAGGLFLLWRHARRGALEAWRRRGVPDKMLVTYRADEDALVVATPAMESRLSWGGLSEITLAPGCWLFIGQGSAHFLPRRLFLNDAAAERAFLAACLERLSPEAHARSAKAVAFAA